MTKPEYRIAQRNCFCRVCDKTIERNIDYMVHWYSHRNRGQSIHVCPDCIEHLGEVLRQGELNIGK